MRSGDRRNKEEAPARQKCGRLGKGSQTLQIQLARIFINIQRLENLRESTKSAVRSPFDGKDHKIMVAELVVDYAEHERDAEFQVVDQEKTLNLERIDDNDDWDDDFADGV